MQHVGMRDRASSATDTPVSANMPVPVAQGCGCEEAITGMSCKHVSQNRLAALSILYELAKPLRATLHQLTIVSGTEE